MKRRLIRAIMFVLLLGSVVLVRVNPVVFDFNIIHNSYSLNILFREQTIIPWIIGLSGLLLTMILGPIFCAYICPFGTLQSILYNLGRVLGLNRKVNLNLHKVLSYIKYIVLIVFVYLLTNDQVLTYINLDPYHAFIRLFFGGITLYGGLYLILVVISSLFIERPFCNYLCPYGAGLNLISAGRLFKIERTDACIHCQKCVESCPVQIQITSMETVHDVNCMGCQKCIDVCPKEGAIGRSFNKLSLIILPLVIVGIAWFTMPQEKPQLDEVINEVEEVVELEEEIQEEEIILKETSTVDLYYHHSIDLIPIESIVEKNAIAIQKHKEELERLEAERQAKIAAEKAAKEKAEKEAAEKAAAEKAAAEKAAEEAAQNQSSGGTYYRDGTYTAKVNAFAPDMLVQVVIKDDQIVSVDVLSHNETQSYYRFSAQKMFNKIIEANSPDVTVVAGCTYTSIGIRNGVRNCLSQAEK